MMIQGMQYLAIGIPASVAVIAGVIKLRFRREFATAVVAWGVLPPRGIRPFTTGLPAAEVAAGLAAIGLTLMGRQVAAVALLAPLFLLLAAGQAVILRRSVNPSCGCFGRTAGPIGTGTIVRAAALALLPVAAIIVF
jgi:hypothetical protein